VIGIAAVLVQAKDEAAKAWYLRQAEFMAFPEDGRVLWLPVEMVVRAVVQRWVGTHPHVSFIVRVGLDVVAQSCPARTH
jgi:hypothetical protein